MTQPDQPVSVPALPPGGTKTELKVKLASWAAFGASLAGLTVLEWVATDLVPALPSGWNWAVPIVGAALTAAVTWVTGYNTRNRPDGLSQSTIDGIREWMRRRLPR